MFKAILSTKFNSKFSESTYLADLLKFLHAGINIETTT